MKLVNGDHQSMNVWLVLITVLVTIAIGVGSMLLGQIDKSEAKIEKNTDRIVEVEKVTVVQQEQVKNIDQRTKRILAILE